MIKTYIVNQEDLKQKISRIKENGKDSLHVIADFDRTLTRPYADGRKSRHTHALVREGCYLGKEHADKDFALFDEYHPIEIDDSLSKEERAKKMQEWWQKHIDLMVKHGMTQEILREIIRNGEIIFRDKSDEFFEILHNNGIPLLIFSAGNGDIIEGFLEEKRELFENIHVIANFLEFDSNGKAAGYKTKIIHVLNKNEVAIRDSPYVERVKERRNVILLGDHIGDANMAEGIDHEIRLKIGFCNFEFEKNKEVFGKYFDVVLPDTDMEYVNSLLREILE